MSYKIKIIKPDSLEDLLVYQSAATHIMINEDALGVGIPARTDDPFYKPNMEIYVLETDMPINTSASSTEINYVTRVTSTYLARGLKS